MNNFRDTILVAVIKYKSIIRRELPSTSYSKKISKLDIRSKTVIVAEDTKLYRSGQMIISDLRIRSSNVNGKKSNPHHGTKLLLQYLEKIMANYYIEDGQVISRIHRASHALMETVQLIAQMGDNGLTQGEIIQIKCHADVVAYHGNNDQKKLFLKALNGCHQHLTQYFCAKLYPSQPPYSLAK